MLLRTRLQISLTLLVAAAVTVRAAQAGSGSWLEFSLLLLAVLAGSKLKVVLPRGDGSMSLNFPFILLGIVQLPPLEAMLLTGLSVAAQCRIRTRKLFPVVQAGFNVANAMLAAAGAWLSFAALHQHGLGTAPALALASVSYFLWNTGSVALILAPSRGESAFAVWRKEFTWYLPFYLVGAVLAALVDWMSARYGWSTALLLIPFVYILHRAYTGQVSRLEERQRHLEETEALQLRTIEGLAMAIEAKDQNTHDHLFRVRHYVKAVGQALRLSKLEMQALETAAFLHDIGKLAVPEHIINKPGKLTPDEFEKMKIHPVVGADILERVRFPYPVVPIVRSHHERWDGAGYPDRLQGTAIPIGARILTVVDCFDALVSDRPYRRGLSSAAALNMIRDLSGKQFDPAVVEIFERCHAEAERSVESLIPSGFTPLNTDIEVGRGVAPGAGYQAGSEEPATVPHATSADARRGPDLQVSEAALDLIAAASQEAQSLFELSQSVGNALTPGEIVAVMASRLRGLLPFQVCGVYLRRGDTLDLRFVDSEGAQPLTRETVQLGSGISGWVAQSRKPILNGNASVEPGCPHAANGTPALRSALSVPLFDVHGETFAVLTLYSVKADVFSRDHLRMLLAMEPKLALCVQNALQFGRSELEGDTDFLTSLPNARRLFLQLEAELTHHTESHPPLAVVVCDLNGFKEVNDRRGHLAGNRLLRLLAEGLRELCTGVELVARMGGDEFVFLLPGVTEAEAADRMAAIRAAAETAGRRAGQGMRISVSVGAACCPADGNITETLLAAADRRMYQDKQRHYSSSTAKSVNLSAAQNMVVHG